ncbi:MAG: hypothetical protein AAB401_01185, partial [Acidobacteriota bacterium]
MRYRQFLFLSVLILAGFVGQSLLNAGAEQKPGEKVAGATQEEPVAITARTKVEAALESKVITPEDFGNFRFPAINNKGEIAFLALFTKPGAVNNTGQAIFVRQADGSWKITREGEKAVNLSEAIYGFSVPNFNDSGYLTFFSGFGTPASKTAFVPLDPNDPAGQ